MSSFPLNDMFNTHKRRRLADTAEEPVVQKNPQLWIDKFPEEVRERIVVHASRGLPTPVAIRIGHASPALRATVLSLFGYTFTCNGDIGRYTEMLCWAALLGEDVRKIDYIPSSNGYWYPELISLTVPMLSYPNLRAVHIADFPEQLAALSQSSSVTEVSIDFMGITSGKKIFDTLANLRVKKLTTNCEVYCRNSCPFADPLAFGPNLNALITRCPHVESLDLNCSDFCVYNVKNGRPEHPIWQAVPALKCLRNLSLSHNIVGTIFRYLSTLGSHDSVKPLVRGPLASRVRGALKCLRLGDSWESMEGRPRISVTQLDTKDPIVQVTELRATTLRASQISGMSQCHGLKKAKLQVTEKNEAAIQEAIQSLPELETLHVEWQVKAKRGRYNMEIMQYRDALPGMMLRGVQGAKKLSDLRLLDVRINLSEMVAILECLGPRLRKLRTSILDQEELPVERLMVLFKTAAKHNRELRDFSIRDSDGIPRDVPSRLRAPSRRSSGRAGKVDQTLLSRGQALLARLNLYAPFLAPTFSDSQCWYTDDVVELMSGLAK